MVGAHGVNGYKAGTLTLWEKNGLMNWLIPGAYFLYIGTCLKLIAKFILIFSSLSPFASDVSSCAFLGAGGGGKSGCQDK